MVSNVFQLFFHLCHCNIFHLSDIFSVMYIHPVGIQIVSHFTVLNVNVAVVKLTGISFHVSFCMYYVDFVV